MRNGIVGAVIGLVLGIVVGATVVAPRLAREPGIGLRTVGIGGERPESLGTAPLARAPAPRLRWNMGSAYAGSLPQLGTLAKRFGEEIWRVSGGDMEIRFHEPGTLVPDFEMFDAVASGAIDAAFASPGRWGERHPALRLFAAVPFGPSASEYLAWIYFGGGRELFEEIHRRNSIHSLFCGVIAPEASGWFRKEVRTVEDLKGLKMGFLGLGAKVMAKLGVETVPLTGGNVFLAMERGTVDATEFSMPAIDLELGLYEMAKHYYFPGWHQPATLFALMINLDKWQGLGAARKARIEAVCGDNIRYGLAEGEALQFVALKKLNALGVILHRWPAPILEALEKAWREVAVEEATADADFKRVWESLSAFRREYGIWRELGHL